MDKTFTHLHLHTPYSLLDGFAKIDEIIEKAKNSGMKAIAITDHGVMFGAIEFYKAAKKHNIKPIIGCELYTSARSHLDKEPIDKKSGHIILLAKDKQGYKNLIKLVSIGYVDGFYYKPRVDYELLEKYSQGLICLSACLAGDIQQQILSGNYDKAKEIALKLNKIYGDGNFYLEMQDHGIPEQKKVNLYLKKLSKETSIPLVVTNDVHYVNKQDNKIHQLLLCIQTGKTLQDENKMEFLTNEFYFKTPQEMYEVFENDEEALENTNKIADMCNLEFDFHSYHLPRYDVPKEYTAYEYLRKLCYEGIQKRYENLTDEIKERLEFELNVINSMGYVEYFLIVWDFVNFAKNNGVVVGAGRGSAAGSIVSYSLGITNIDPLKFNLLFERFLNPERVSMPDIDIDFSDETRYKVIDYVKQKYGVDHVSQIITFGTFGAKVAIRDCARAMSISYALADKIAKMIPTKPLGMTIEKAMNLNPELKKIYDEDQVVRNLLDNAKKIEGNPRHASTHAAGVVISNKPVDNYVPLYKQDENISAQFTMNILEELGLLKMDFLGLRTLTVIEKTIETVSKTRNVNIDLDKIDYEDKNVYDLISQGKTLGAFQIESEGMQQLMKELKPEHIEDIIAGIALYRPGPMASISTYIKNKENEKNISYIHEKLRPILSVTKGILIYQEQVMQIVRQLAGYSYARADIVRRAISKKKMDVMEKERKIFIYGSEEDNIPGCIKNGVSEDIANKIFDDVIDFGNYAFNKSHSAAYAVISYQTAYLKRYYAPEFMAALMSSFIGNPDKLVEYKIDCEQNNIKILKPDVNYSFADFYVDGNDIRFPLSALKGVGINVAKNIADEREKNGLYTSFENLVERLESKNINKKVSEALIKSGALDSIIQNRASIMSEYENIISSIQDRKRNNISGQISFFGSDFMKQYENTNHIKIKEFSQDVLLSMEKEILGFYLSGNPLDKYQELIKEKIKYSTTKLKSIKVDEDISYEQSKDFKCDLICRITKVKVITTKKNQMMAFLTVEDLISSIEVIVFPTLYVQNTRFLMEDTIVYISGKLSIEDEDMSNKIIAENISSVDDLISKKIYIRVEKFKDSDVVNKIEKLINLNGNSNIYFYDLSTKKVMVNDRLKIQLNEETIRVLKNIAGDENVRVV